MARLKYILYNPRFVEAYRRKKPSQFTNCSSVMPVVSQTVSCWATI
ncbi:hypothetical protein [Candidatus Avelusimicrobium faecicola]